MNIDALKPYAKAIVAFIAPGVTALVAAVQESSPKGSDISGPEWIGIFAVCVLTSGAVFAVPNKDPRGVKQAESVQPPEASLGDGLGDGVQSIITDGIVGIDPTKPTDDGPKPTGGYWGGV